MKGVGWPSDPRDVQPDLAPSEPVPEFREAIYWHGSFAGEPGFGGLVGNFRVPTCTTRHWIDPLSRLTLITRLRAIENRWVT